MDKKSLQFDITIIVPWIKVKNAAGHHTWHLALNSVEICKVEHFGLRSDSNPIWIQQVFPNSVTKRFQILSPISFNSFLNRLRRNRTNQTCVVIFEGSLFWALILGLTSLCDRNSVFICNLWPSHRYLDILRAKSYRSKWLKCTLSFLELFKRLQITVDTKVLADLLSKSYHVTIKDFPVPSSLEYRKESRSSSEHYRVSLLMRGVELSRAVKLLKDSCQMCTFHIGHPAGNASTIRTLFQGFLNVEVGDRYIGEEEYEAYIDSFDHAILLYQPLPISPGSFSHFCASGKLLDLLLRRVPISLPDKGLEWINLAKRWGSFSLFDFESDESIKKELNHPQFTKEPSHLSPPFSPSGSVSKLVSMSEDLAKHQRDLKNSDYLLNYVCTLICYTIIFSHWIFGLLANTIYSLRYRLRIKSKKIVD